MAHVGKIRYSDPRSVLIRNPDNLNEVHSTIGCMLHIETDHKEEGRLIMDLLPTLLEEMSEKLQEHLDAAFPKTPDYG